MIRAIAPRRVSGPLTSSSRQFTKASALKSNYPLFTAQPPCGSGLPRLASRRSPSSGVGLFLEVSAGDELLLQILRIVDDGRHDEPRIAIRLIGAIEILGKDRIAAIRHTVLAQISGAHVGGNHFEGTPARWRSPKRR